MRLEYALPKVSTILLLIAHPDDETMFFSPTVLALLRECCRVCVLCLSTGDKIRNLLKQLPA